MLLQQLPIVKELTVQIMYTEQRSCHPTTAVQISSLQISQETRHSVNEVKPRCLAAMLIES